MKLSITWPRRKHYIQILPSERYERVIRIDAPLTLYWLNGELDGLEFFTLHFTKAEQALLNEVLNALEPAVGGRNDPA